MDNPNQPLRVVTILAEADHAAFRSSATAALYESEGVEITVMGINQVDDTDEVVCELVAHLRRIRPNVVITSGPWDGAVGSDQVAVSQLATAAVMLAADPRYGHACCSRGAHAVAKLYYTAAHGPVTTRVEADTYYCAFSTVERGRAIESDLFGGLRRSPSQVAVAA